MVIFNITLSGHYGAIKNKVYGAFIINTQGNVYVTMLNDTVGYKIVYRTKLQKKEWGVYSPAMRSL